MSNYYGRVFPPDTNLDTFANLVDYMDQWTGWTGLNRSNFTITGFIDISLECGQTARLERAIPNISMSYSSTALCLMQNGDIWQGDFPYNTAAGSLTYATSKVPAIGEPNSYEGYATNKSAKQPLFEFIGYVYRSYTQSVYPLLLEKPIEKPFVTYENNVNSTITLEPRQYIESQTLTAKQHVKTVKFSSFKLTQLGVVTTTIDYTLRKYTAMAVNQTITVYTHKYSNAFYQNAGSYDFKITIGDWANKAYTIIDKKNVFKIYAGKQIGTDFLNNYQFVYKQWNTYGEKVDVINQTLQLSGVTPKIFGENDVLRFSYTYNGNEARHVSQRRILGLATGNTKFNLLTYKSTFKIGEIFNASDINVNTLGSLQYVDGTSIALKDVAMNQDVTVTTNLGNSFYIDQNIKSFDVTITLPTKYFGTLTHTYTANVNGVLDETPVRVELVNAKQNFNASEILDFGSAAELVCYNANDIEIRRIPATEFQGTITTYPDSYGQKVPEIYWHDTESILKGVCLTSLEFTWKIAVTYSDKKLGLTTTNVKKKYFINNYADFSVDTTNLVVTETIHRNTIGNLGVIETINITTSLCKVQYEPFTINTGSKVIPINITYLNEFNQELTGRFEVEVVKIEPVKLEITGSSDTTKYWSNGTDKFHFPTGLTFNVVYSDNHKEAVADMNSLEFYRNKIGESYIDKLVPNTSVIKESDGNRIYVYDHQRKVGGSYIIEFQLDTIKNIYLDNNVNFTLGNRLNSYRDLFKIKVLYASGNIADFDNYAFVETKPILAAQDIKIAYEETQYTLDNKKITFVKPSISKVEIESTGFQTIYNNTTDSINCTSLVVKVHYLDSEYIQTCTYDTDKVVDTSHYQITCDRADMATYVFDGSQKLQLNLSSVSEISFNILFNVKSIYDETKGVGKLNVRVLEILDIIGISINSVYRDYHIGERFLKDEDTTEITVFYRSSENGTQHKFVGKLNSDITAINVLPTKGSEFTTLGPKTIRVSSATNYNVQAEYTIDVKAKYIYETTKKHELVAVKQTTYTLPNAQKLQNVYILVENYDEKGQPTTKIDASGARVFENGKDINNVKVYGYLEDLFDKGKNARVILFEDYIPPVDGQNNIEVTYPCYVEGNADKINKCHFGILFGNNNSRNRLFVSGNEDTPNCDWHSGMVHADNVEYDDMLKGNFGYFEDTSYCFYGETDNKVIGYDIVSNDKLLVLKDKSDKETTIYFRTPTLVTAIDGAGTKLGGIDNEPLYQEEFALVKGNNSVAGISPKSIVNFNGDTLFVSNDNNVVGLDLTGIIGDNQRYANTRSYFIDEDLKDRNLNKSWLWTDNKYLLFCLKDKTYLTHFEAKNVDSKQYEWWATNTKDIQVLLKTDNDLYYGNSSGEFYKLNGIYDDVNKIFVGQGGGILASEGEQDNKIIVSQKVINELDPLKNYKFKIVPTNKLDESYMYYAIGRISNVKDSNVDFYVNTEFNALEMLCMRGGQPNLEEQVRLTAIISSDKYCYLNRYPTDNDIGCSYGSKFGEYYKKYRLEPFVPDFGTTSGSLYKIYDSDGQEMNVSELYRAILCYRLDSEYQIVDINKQEQTFKLVLEGRELDLVRYADQSLSRAFKAEIKSYEPVEAFFITKPYTLGDLNYFKTIWQYTLTNDTNIPSELELTYASNKIPYEDSKTLAKISVDKFSFSLNDFSFSKVDFDKHVVPRTYTNRRILPNQKFICFGFKNYNNTNSVLSSMSIVYSIPTASYSGD